MTSAFHTSRWLPDDLLQVLCLSLNIGLIVSQPRLFKWYTPLLLLQCALLTCSTRYFLRWLFGRAIGWTAPEVMSTRAIHQQDFSAFELYLEPCQLIINLFYQVVEALLTMPLLARALAATRSRKVLLTVALLNVSTIRSRFWWILSSLPACTYSISIPKLPRTLRNSLTVLILAATIASWHRFQAEFGLLTDFDRHIAFDAKYRPVFNPSRRVRVVIMTAPRRGDPPYLIETISSWLRLADVAAANEARPANVPYSMSRAIDRHFELLVYTHFAQHKVFDRARSTFSSANLVTFMRDEQANDEFDHALHLSRALQLASQDYDGFIALAEDDFPVCSSRRRFDNGLEPTGRILESCLFLLEGPKVTSTPLCGAFFATGGSGLIMHARVARLVFTVLERYRSRAMMEQRANVLIRAVGLEQPDVVIQNCLRGRLPECAALCANKSVLALRPSTISRTLLQLWHSSRPQVGGLVVTERLLQYHLGYNTSTGSDRKYGRNEWSCGWRHPFNGEPDVLVV